MRRAVGMGMRLVISTACLGMLGLLPWSFWRFGWPGQPDPVNVLIVSFHVLVYCGMYAVAMWVIWFARD